MINTEKIRKDFPILTIKVHEKPLIYLDNAATTQKPKTVIKTIKKCTHGASIGQVDSEKLFYLMSRGFTKTNATKTLIEAFFASLLKKANNQLFTERIQKLTEQKLTEQKPAQP